MPGFNLQSGKRISKVVRDAEGQAKNARSRRSRLRRPPGDMLQGVLDTQLDYDSSARMSIWGGDVTKGEYSDTGDNLEEVWSHLLKPDQSLDAGTHVKADWINGAWWVTASWC